MYTYQSGDDEVYLEDETGKPMTAMIVFTESLK